VWLLESRTKEDAAADRYRCVSAPYAAIDRKMRAKVHQGNGAILHETGTTIRSQAAWDQWEEQHESWQSSLTPTDLQGWSTDSSVVGTRG